EIKGRKTVQRTKSRSTGNIRKKARKKKREYMILTRKLRGYLKGLKAEGKILGEHVTDMRKKIRNREFRSRAHLKEHIGGIQK
ncbi:MAG: 50S ribosomal protein L19e, partial [Nanoarchaeota archaeon]|nr:50S ribosomal protein L19e [Nanoarchaeota archaeon]